MKHIIVLIFLFTFIESTAQIDSLRINRIESNQDHIQLNLKKAHDRYADGTQFIIGGVALAAIDILLYHKMRDKPEEQKPRFVYFGAVVVSIGVAIQIDSHKFIKRASIGVR